MAKLVPLARSPVPKAGGKLAGAHQGKRPTGSFILTLQIQNLRENSTGHLADLALMVGEASSLGQNGPRKCPDALPKMDPTETLSPIASGTG